MSFNTRFYKPAAIVLLIGILIAALGAAIVQSLMMTPRQRTRSNIMGVGVRIFDYVNKYNKIPPNLKVLPEIKDKDNETIDGWNREIIYEVDTTGKVTLKSLGKDGIVGGINDDSDIICSFPLRDGQGKWNHLTVIVTCMKDNP